MLSRCFATTNNQLTSQQSSQPTGLSKKHHSKQFAQYIADTFLWNPHEIFATSDVIIWLLSSNCVLSTNTQVSSSTHLTLSDVGKMDLMTNLWISVYVGTHHFLFSAEMLAALIAWSEISFPLMRACVCVRTSVCLLVLRITDRLGRGTHAIFIQNLYKYRWITAVKEL